LIVAMRVTRKKHAKITEALDLLETHGAERHAVYKVVEPLLAVEASWLNVELSGKDRETVIPAHTKNPASRDTAIHAATVTMPDGSEAKGYSHGRT
jgi:hypothetical protein